MAFGDLGLVEQCRRRAVSPVIFDLEQQLGHGGEIGGLVHALKGRREVEIEIRIVLFQKILIIGGENFHPHGVDGDALVDEGPVARLAPTMV